MINLYSRKSGFTIVELMIAITVFSVLLLIILSAFLTINRLFYKGVNMSNTQETARIVLQDISDDVRFSQGGDFRQPAPNFFCIGQHRYRYNLFQQIGDPATTFALVRENVTGGCPDLATAGTKPEELLGQGMQLNQLNVNCISSQFPARVTPPCTIRIRILFYGSRDMLVSPSGFDPAWQAPDADCSGGPNSSQYCATAVYTSTILQTF